MTVNINQGTQTAINTQTVGAAEAQVVRVDTGVGTSSATLIGTALSDTHANPTSVQTGAFLMGWSTTQWERLRTDQGDGGASTGLFNTVPMVYNGTTYSRLRGDLNGISAFGRHQDEFATVVSTGTTTLGTIKAAVSGSQIFVTSLIISAGSATVVVVASGGTSTPVLGSLQLNQNGGLNSMPINPPLRTAVGSALVYQQSVGCALSITCTGYVD